VYLSYSGHIATPSSEPAPSGNPEHHRARPVAESFGLDAERYDRTRPRYPQAFVERIAFCQPALRTDGHRSCSRIAANAMGASTPYSPGGSSAVSQVAVGHDDLAACRQIGPHVRTDRDEVRNRTPPVRHLEGLAMPNAANWRSGSIPRQGRPPPG
jgi:hypothetical protein